MLTFLGGACPLDRPSCTSVARSLGHMTVIVGLVACILGEYTSLALAKVWTGTAKLPSKRMMQDEHHRTIEKCSGYSKDVLFLPFEESRGVSLPLPLSQFMNHAL